MYKKILVPLDTSALAEQALQPAAALAAASGAELKLVLVHEPQPVAGFPDAPWNAARTTMEASYLETKVPELAKNFGIHVSADHPTGPAAESIAIAANAHQADLVVMTTHGRTGLSRAWLGSVADRVMRSIDVPVLMLRPTGAPLRHKTSEAPPLRRIMIPLDGSARAEAIIPQAIALGGKDATYIITRIVPTVPIFLNTVNPYTMTTLPVDAAATERLANEATIYVSRVAARLREQGLRCVDEHVEIAENTGPSLLLAASATCADVIAIATHGRGSSRFLLGSVTDKLLRGGAANLLVCRDPTE